MDDQNLDPVEVARVIAGLLLSQKLAVVVGPYAVIFLAAMAGAATALANREQTPRFNSFWFFGWTTLIAVLLTVPAANLVARYNDSWQAQWFFIPTAFVLSYAGDKWKSIFAFLLDQAKVLVSNWVNSKGEPK